MKTRVVLHLLVLASAVAVFTATAIAKFSSPGEAVQIKNPIVS